MQSKERKKKKGEKKTNEKKTSIGNKQATDARTLELSHPRFHILYY